MRTYVDSNNQIQELKSLAEIKAEERIASIRQSLKMLETELGKWESLTNPNWADVGDLQHIDAELTAVWEFASETEHIDPQFLEDLVASESG